MPQTIDQAIIEINGEVRGLRADFNKALGEVDRFSKKTDKRFKGLKKSATLLKSAFAALGVGLATRAVVNASVSMEALNNKMLAATGSSRAAESSMAFVRAESERLGLNLAASADGFAGFSAAALRSGLDLGQTKQIFSDIGEAVTSLQLSAERTGLVFRALEQISSKGVVSMEEIKLQLGDSLPGALEIAARSMGETTQDFMKMVENGEVMSKDFLPKFAASIKENLGGAAESASNSAKASFARLSNESLILKDNLGKELLPTIKSISDALAAMTQRANIGFSSKRVKNVTALNKEILETKTSLRELRLESVGFAHGGIFGRGFKERVSNHSDAVKRLTTKLAELTAERKSLISVERGGLKGLDNGGAGGDVDSKNLGKKGGVNGFSVLGIDREKLEEELIELEEGFLTKEQLEIQHSTNRLEAIAEALAAEVKMTDEQKQLLSNVQMNHEAKIKAIKDAARKKDLQDKGKELKGLISQTSSHNKVMFNINKAAALAEALMGAREAIHNAYVWGSQWGPHVGAAAGAVAAVATASNVAAIAGSSFGGGGSVGGTTTGGAVSVRDVDDFGTPTTPAVQQREVTIVIEGDQAELSKDLIRSITDGINEFTQEDGGVLYATEINGVRIA